MKPLPLLRPPQEHSQMVALYVGVWRRVLTPFQTASLHLQVPSPPPPARASPEPCWALRTASTRPR